MQVNSKITTVGAFFISEGSELSDLHTITALNIHGDYVEK
jgi:hypothetical protein